MKILNVYNKWNIYKFIENSSLLLINLNFKIFIQLI